MTRLREQDQNQGTHKDWVSLKDISPFKVEENTWMLWASWGFIFLLPILSLAFLAYKLLP